MNLDLSAAAESLRGILLLIQEPIRIGDQIEVEGYEGTVTAVKDRVITRGKMALEREGFDIPYPMRTIFFNDETDRSGQESASP